MEDEYDVHKVSPTLDEAEALVSKWLEDSNEEADATYASDTAMVNDSKTLSRVEGVGLGAEDLSDLLAQRRLDPIERKMKYKIEANTKWKAQREKEAMELARRLEEDIYDLESKSVQISKKRHRGISKAAFIEQFMTVKKKPKVQETPNSKTEQLSPVQFVPVPTTSEEIIFDFSKKPENNPKTHTATTSTTKEEKEEKRCTRPSAKKPETQEKYTHQTSPKPSSSSFPTSKSASKAKDKRPKHKRQDQKHHK